MNGLTLDVVTDLDGLVDLRGDWSDAAAADPDPNVFLSWSWTYTWWRHFGAGRAGHQLHVAVIRDRQGVVAIAPLYRSKVGAGPVTASALRPISHDAGDYGGALLARRADDAVAVLVDHLGAQLHAGVAVVVLPRLASDAPFTALLGDELVRHAATVETVVDRLGESFLFTDARAGFDLAERASSHETGTRLRRLTEQHDDVAFVDHTGDTLEAGLDRLSALHERRQEGRHEESGETAPGLLDDPGDRAFLFDAVRELDAERAVRLLALEAGGRPIAVELCFAYPGRIFLFEGAFDPDFAAFSPGHLLTERVIEDGLAAGVATFDFCRDDAPYALSWTNRERHRSTVTLSRPGLAGAVARQRFRLGRAAERRIGTRRSRARTRVNRRPWRSVRHGPPWAATPT
jgi:CelD/BcsL family acetyltransferase involved in cellulose biosynthesis